MQLLPRSSSAATARKPVPTSTSASASPTSPTATTPLPYDLPPVPPTPESAPTPASGGGLKKSKSVRAKKALKTIANPIKTRREEKARRNEVETEERKLNEKNVQDFLVAGRDYCERNFS